MINPDISLNNYKCGYKLVGKKNMASYLVGAQIKHVQATL